MKAWRIGVLLSAGAVAMVSSGCVANISRKTYEPVCGKAAPAGSFEDDFVVQIGATNHGTGALHQDDRAPYEVHTRYETKTPYRACSIDGVTLECGAFRQTLVGPGDQLSATAESIDKGANAGSYHAQINLPQTFDFVPADPAQTLTLTIHGRVQRRAGQKPFVVRRKFRYEVFQKVVFVTFDALMGI